VKIPKRHLKESDAPLLPGTDQLAMCGEIVPRASFPFMYEDSLSYHFAEFLSSLHVCKGCYQTELAIANVRKQWNESDEPLGARYVYGLAAGQEEMDAEREHYAELIEAA
jgi:hypothetical protein